MTSLISINQSSKTMGCLRCCSHVALPRDSPAQPIASYPSTGSPVGSRPAYELLECIIARVVVQLVLLNMFIRVIDNRDINKLLQLLGPMVRPVMSSP